MATLDKGWRRLVTEIGVEFMSDRAFALPPFDDAEARRLIDGLAVRPLLDGKRGAAPADIDTLAGALAWFSVMAADLGDVLQEVSVVVTDAADLTLIPADDRGGRHLAVLVALDDGALGAPEITIALTSDGGKREERVAFARRGGQGLASRGPEAGGGYSRDGGTSMLASVQRNRCTSR